MIGKNVTAHAVSTSVFRVHYIDVGRADSILVQQGNYNMLIDAGNNADSTTNINYLKSQGVSKMDVVVGTHPHEDHIGSLDAVINTFPIGKLYMPNVTATTQTYQDVITAIKNKGLTITNPVPGSTFTLDSAIFTILAPNSGSYSDLNNYSIVLRATFGINSFLFAGDAEDVSESEMLSKGYNLKADVLKVGHHGSAYSTTIDFLNAVNPRYAVISVVLNNSYGLPAAGKIDKLKNRGVAIYRTDTKGTIVAESNGTSITFNKIAAISGTTYKAGWNLINGKWFYYNSDGNYKIGWAYIGSKWYYFDTSGAVKTGWTLIGGKWYYFDSNGVWIK